MFASIDIDNILNELNDYKLAIAMCHVRHTTLFMFFL